MRVSAVRVVRAWYSSALPPRLVPRLAPSPPRLFDLLVGRFVAQPSRSGESEALCAQLRLFDLTQPDSFRLQSVLAHLDKLGQRDLPLCERIASELESRGHLPSSHEQLDTLVTSLETSSRLGEPFEFAKCSMICQNLCHRENIPAHALVRIASSLGVMNHFDRPLCEHMAAQMVRGELLPTLPLHDVCAVLFTFAKFDFRHPLWLRHVAGELGARNLHELPLSTLRQVIHSLSRLRVCSRLLTKHLVNELVRRDAKQFSTSELVSLMESFAFVKQRSERLCELVAKELLLPERDDASRLVVTGLGFDQLSSLIVSFATVRVCNKALLREFCHQVVCRDLGEVECDDTLVLAHKGLQVLRNVALFESASVDDDSDDDDEDEDDKKA